METNDYSRIATAEQLRSIRKSIEAELAMREARVVSECRAFRSMFSSRMLILPVIRKLREYLTR